MLKSSRSSYNKDELNQITNEGDSGKYFHQMLNIYDDDLDPYEYRLLGHFIRVCGNGGECWQGTRTIAAITRMSTGQVQKVRKRLADKGYIRVAKGNRKDTTRVTVVDLMPDNVARYATGKGVHHMNTGVHHMNTGVHHMNTGVHHMNTGVHQVNERISLEEEPRRRTSEEESAPQKQTDQTISYAERLKAKGIIGG